MPGRPLIVLVALASLAVVMACGDDDGHTGGSAPTSASSTSVASTSSAGGGGSGGDGDACATLQCGDGAFCYDGVCRSCDAPEGALSDQVLSLGDGEEDRAYFLYVPDGYDCSEPAPLLVDFHGTAGGPRPEEAHQTEAIVALAEAERAIVVRPRSRSSEEGSFEIFRWDQNPGDLARNTTYAVNLVDSLRQRYHVDGARIYASGFSSGANMSAQFLGAQHRGLFRGVAPIAGGFWADPNITPFDGAPPRVYAATGYRDYLFGTARDLLGALDGAGIDDELVFFRETDTGHELYDWHFPELFAWLDRGERPVDAALLAPWTAEALPTESSVLATSTTSSGEIVATTARAEILRRSTDGAWSLEVTSPADVAWTAACASPTGDTAFVAGEGLFSSRSGGTWSNPVQLPEIGTPMFGFGYMNGLACSGAADVVAVGYWGALRSDDAAGSWGEWGMPAGPGYEAQGASVAVAGTGTAIAVGFYNYVGRSAAGGDLVSAAHQAVSGWWNDVAANADGTFLAVGDTGAVIRSNDDGASWFSASVAANHPLYAIAFGPDGLAAVATGFGGTVFYTRDAGLTWASLPTGLDARFLGAATFVDADTVLVGGERGTMLRADLPR